MSGSQYSLALSTNRHFSKPGTVLVVVVVKVTQSCLTLATSGTVAHQVPLSMGFSRLEYWSRLPFSTLEDLPDPGIRNPHLLQLLTTSATWDASIMAQERRNEGHTKSNRFLSF